MNAGLYDRKLFAAVCNQFFQIIYFTNRMKNPGTGVEELFFVLCYYTYMLYDTQAISAAPKVAEVLLDFTLRLLHVHYSSSELSELTSSSDDDSSSFLTFM
jgi:hypothetical protein